MGNYSSRTVINSAMDTDKQTSQFFDLPPEMCEAIFSHFNDEEIARNRRVCQHWKLMLEIFYTTYLETGNHNWNNFLAETTAAKLRVLASDLTYPIYESPLFPPFANRITVLEFSGFVPIYNLVNIIFGCKVLNSLAILEIRVGDIGEIQYPDEVKQGDGLIQVRKLYFCPRAWEVSTRAITAACDVIGTLLKPNTMVEVNLSAEYALDVIVRRIYSNIFQKDEAIEAADFAGKHNRMMHIIQKQSESLEKIRFNYLYDVLPKKPELFIKFHSFAQKNRPFIIQHSCLFKEARLGLESQPFRQELTIREILTLYDSQSEMENLRVMFCNDTDLNQIQGIVAKNARSLEYITIASVEVVGTTLRWFDASIFSSCLRLKELSLRSGINYKNNQLINLGKLPELVSKLRLIGFIPTFVVPANELFNHESWRCSHLQNLTKLTLDHLPWFIMNGTPVRVMQVTHIRFLLRSFQKLKQLRLHSFIPERFLTPELSQIIGYPFPENPISDELVAWCQNGGDSRQGISIQQNQNALDKISYSITIEENARKKQG